jgi:hypothetical protein
MNGRLAKKIRKVAEVNVYSTYVGLIQSLMKLPLKKRVKFGYCIIFKRPYSYGEEKRGWTGKGVLETISKGCRKVLGFILPSTRGVTGKV